MLLGLLGVILIIKVSYFEQKGRLSLNDYKINS